MRVHICIFLFFLIISPVLAVEPAWIYSTHKGNPILDMDISPDGHYLAATDGSLYLLSTSAPEILTQGWVADKAAISGDSSFLATASDMNVCLFNKSGRKEWCNDNFPGEPTAVIAVNNSSIITASSKNGRVYYFNKSGDLSWEKFIGSPIYSLAAPADGDYVTGSAYFEIFFGIYSEGKTSFINETAKGNNIAIMQTAVSPDGRYILGRVDYGSTGKLILFDKYGRTLWEVKTEGIKGGIAISEDGSYIAVGVKTIGAPGGLLSLYQVNHTSKKASLVWSHELESSVQGVAMTENGSYTAVGCSNGVLDLFDKSGNMVMNYKANNEGITYIVTSSDGTFLAAGTSGGNILFFSNATGITSQPGVIIDGSSSNVTATVTETPQSDSIDDSDITPDDESNPEQASGGFPLVLSVFTVFIIAAVWMFIFIVYKKREL